MASKVFLDANILLDLILHREHYSVSRQVFEMAVNSRISAFISPSILHICGYFLTKSYGPSKAKDLLLSVLADVTCIEISQETSIAALHSGIKDIEDALQYYTAIHHKLDYFISRDKSLIRSSIPVLPVYTPEEFINEVS